MFSGSNFTNSCSIYEDQTKNLVQFREKNISRGRAPAASRWPKMGIYGDEIAARNDSRSIDDHSIDDYNLSL